MTKLDKLVLHSGCYSRQLTDLIGKHIESSLQAFSIMIDKL